MRAYFMPNGGYCLYYPLSIFRNMSGYSRIFPSFRRGIFGHVARLDQLRERKYLMDYYYYYYFFFSQCNFIYNSNTYTTYNTDMTLTLLTIYLLITLLILTLLIHALLYNTILKRKNLKKYETTYNTMLMLLRKILVL